MVPGSQKLRIMFGSFVKKAAIGRIIDEDEAKNELDALEKWGEDLELEPEN